MKTRIDNCVYEITFHIVPNFYELGCAHWFRFFKQSHSETGKRHKLGTTISIPERNSHWAQFKKFM